MSAFDGTQTFPGLLHLMFPEHADLKSKPWTITMKGRTRVRLYKPNQTANGMSYGLGFL